MAIQQGEQQVNTFVQGLITEASELTFPENASVDELNCVLSTKGNRVRRLGMDYETSYVTSTAVVSDTNLETYAISTNTWKAVGETGGLNFTVVQIGNTLHFYDASNAALSSAKKTFTVDLDSYLAPSATTAATSRISVATGRGALFVVSASIEPIKIEYDADGDSITTSQIEHHRS